MTSRSQACWRLPRVLKSRKSVITGFLTLYAFPPRRMTTPVCVSCTWASRSPAIAQALWAVPVFPGITVMPPTIGRASLVTPGS